MYHTIGPGDSSEGHARVETESSMSSLIRISLPKHPVGACGCRFGFTWGSERCRLQARPHVLPRIEVAGDDDPQAFIAKLGG